LLCSGDVRGADVIRVGGRGAGVSGPRTALGLLAFLTGFVGLLVGLLAVAMIYPTPLLDATAVALLVFAATLAVGGRIAGR